MLVPIGEEQYWPKLFGKGRIESVAEIQYNVPYVSKSLRVHQAEARTSICQAVFAQRSRVTERLTDAGIIDRNSPHFMHSMRPYNVQLAMFSRRRGLMIKASFFASDRGQIRLVKTSI